MRLSEMPTLRLRRMPGRALVLETASKGAVLMADVGDLRQKAEAAKVAYGDLRSLGMHPDRLAIIEEYQAASDPDTFLATAEAEREHAWDERDAALSRLQAAEALAGELAETMREIRAILSTHDLLRNAVARYMHDLAGAALARYDERKVKDAL